MNRVKHFNKAVLLNALLNIEIVIAMLIKLLTNDLNEIGRKDYLKKDRRSFFFIFIFSDKLNLRKIQLRKITASIAVEVNYLKR